MSDNAEGGGAIGITAPPAKCRYCRNDLIEGATFCPTCSKFQCRLRNLITDAGNITAALTMFGALGLFILSTYTSDQTEREGKLAKLDAEELSIANSVLKRYAQTVDSIDRIMRRYDDVVSILQIELWRSEIRAGRYLVKELPGTCATGEASGCRLGLFESTTSKEQALLTFEKSGSIATLDLFRQHFVSLGAVTLAEDSSQIIRDVDSAMDALRKIASESGAYYLLDPKVSYLATPDTIRAELEGLDVRDARWQALRDVTTAASELLYQFNDDFGSINLLRRHDVTDGFDPRFRDSLNRFNRDPSSSNFRQLWETSTTLDVLLSMNPQDLLYQLAQAHLVMKQKLESGGSLQVAGNELSSVQRTIHALESSFDFIAATTHRSQEESEHR